jgi:hypothetical protein
MTTVLAQAIAEACATLEKEGGLHPLTAAGQDGTGY